MQVYTTYRYAPLYLCFFMLSACSTTLSSKRDHYLPNPAHVKTTQNKKMTHLENKHKVILPDIKLFTNNAIHQILETPVSSKQNTFIDPPADFHSPLTLWEQIQQDLQLQRYYQHPQVDHYYQYYLKNKRHIQQSSERAEPILHLIYQQLHKKQLPAELLLLPIIESSYSPLAHSPNGAAGIWQFMPATGKNYGLIQNYWYDARYNIDLASRAAFNYLTYLYQHFNHNWLLALAAYNAGEGRVRKAIKNNQRQHKATDFWHLSLPTETRQYVPKLLALSKLLQQHGNYFYPIPNNPYLSMVKTKHWILIDTLIRKLNLSKAAFLYLNPGIKTGIIPKNISLLLPHNKAKQFRIQQSELLLAHNGYWRQYTVKKGDTLGQIARYHHSKVSWIKASNQLASSHIRIGQKLLIPNTLPKNNTLLKSQKRQKKAQGLPQHYREYIVQNGDTLWHIARKHQVNVEALKRWNKLSDKRYLQPGQKLLIY